MEQTIREFLHFLNPKEKIRGHAITTGDRLESRYQVDHPISRRWECIPKESVGRFQPEGPNVATVVCPE